MTREQKAKDIANNYLGEDRTNLATAILEALEQAYNEGATNKNAELRNGVLEEVRNKIVCTADKPCKCCWGLDDKIEKMITVTIAQQKIKDDRNVPLPDYCNRHEKCSTEQTANSECCHSEGCEDCLGM